MITLYFMGDRSQAMEIGHGLVIGHNWCIRDGKGSIYASTPDRAKADACFARVKARYPNTAWTLKYDCE